MGKEDRDYAILSVSVCTCLYSEEMVRLHSDSCRCLLRMPNGMWILLVRLEPEEYRYQCKLLLTCTWASRCVHPTSSFNLFYYATVMSSPIIPMWFLYFKSLKKKKIIIMSNNDKIVNFIILNIYSKFFLFVPYDFIMKQSDFWLQEEEFYS